MSAVDPTRNGEYAEARDATHGDWREVVEADIEGRRIDWSRYSDRAMGSLAASADLYGRGRLLRKIQRATLRRDGAS